MDLRTLLQAILNNLPEDQPTQSTESKEPDDKKIITQNKNTYPTIGESMNQTCQSEEDKNLPFVNPTKDSPKSLKITGWITLILSSVARLAITIYEFLVG